MASYSLGHRFAGIVVITACVLLCQADVRGQGRGRGPGHPGSRGPSYHAPAPRGHYAPRPASGPHISLFGPSPSFLLAETVRYLLEPPRGCVVLTVGGVTYYQHGYDYYRPVRRDGRWVYVEVAPPPGVIVTTLPPSSDRVIINGQVYYRAGTTYYVEKAAPEVISTPEPVSSGVSTAVPAAPVPRYEVTKPPVGALVETLPKETSTVESNGTTYFESDGVYYLPIRVGEKTKYVIVDKPR